MRREGLFLRDIVDAAAAVERFLAGVDQETFFASELLQSAVLHKLTVIGEAAARLPSELKDRHPEIEWRPIIGFRNIAVHAYFSVDWSIVWVAAAMDAPLLRRQIQAILDDECPEIRPSESHNLPPDRAG